jgi:hypothetical protein
MRTLWRIRQSEGWPDMSLYTRLTVACPWFLKTAAGHWVFWALIRMGRHMEMSRKAFEDAMK